ncbi:hypothetical protein BGX31_003433 [Mortierella sp. GBA43]|nr:hypothetical protein BGX31_003433 [Mortierella sp. GBA43]
MSSTSTYFTACDDEETIEGHDERDYNAWSSMPCLSTLSPTSVAEQSQPEPKKKKTNAFWSGFKALQGIKETASSAIASMSSSSASSADPSKMSPAIATSATVLSKVKKVPDFIFSPRSYTQSRPHESRSFGDFYLCMEGSS